jgi:acyl-CoA reductase-like NAD-dependent aldehyde dehydrogenase
MVKPDIKKAKRHLAKLRQLASKKKTHLADMIEEEVIKAIRKTREEVWETVTLKFRSGILML